MSLDTLKSTDLEKSLRSTIYGKNRKLADQYIMEGLSTKEGDNFSIPIIQSFIEDGSPLEKELLALYDKKLFFEETDGISKEMKLLQASAFDGLVVGVNAEKGGETAIYTANTSAIFNLDCDTKFDISKTASLNKEGIVNAVRVDIEYTSEDGFKFKPVSLNKNTNLKVVNLETGEGRFYLVPYIIYQRSMAFFKEMLDDGRVLEVSQNFNGVLKVREICTKPDILARYCDNEAFARTLRAEYFPLKGFFYAPVLGAPSTTVGKTRVELMNISNVKSVSKPKTSKAVGGVVKMLADSVIQSELTSLKDSNEEAYLNLVCQFPNIGKYIENADSSIIPVFGVIKYLHSIDDDTFNKVVRIMQDRIDIQGRVKGLSKLISRFDYFDKNSLDVDGLKDLLKTNILKIVIRKKNCEYSSMVVTNNKDYLASIYGEDYFARYESLGTRLYELEKRVKEGEDIFSAVKYCGINISLKDCLEAQHIIESTDPTRSTHDRLTELVTGSADVKKSTRKSASNSNMILVRKCFATLISNDVVDYYRYVDLGKIESIHILG